MARTWAAPAGPARRPHGPARRLLHGRDDMADPAPYPDLPLNSSAPYPDPPETLPALPPAAGGTSAMASRARPIRRSLDAMEPERPPPALVSELLEEIFLRVASPSDLARASAACVSFRRLIANNSFLRRYRSIHPPLLLGVVNFSGFHPAEAPHPSAAVARAIAFSFDFLSCTKAWYPFDVRDGRILLVTCSRDTGQVWDLAVCDPLSRQYLLLPLITDDQLKLASIRLDKLSSFVASFIPSGGTEEDISFRVICCIQSQSRLGVFIFSSDSHSSCWSVSTSINLDDIGLDQDQTQIPFSGQCAYGCFYWKLLGMNTLIKLDMNSMQFSTIDLPPGHDEREIIVVESGGSKVAMFSLSVYPVTSVDYYTFPQNGSEKSHEWHMKSTIPLPDDCTGECFMCGPFEGYIFICDSDEEALTFFSLDIKSFNVERVSRTIYDDFTLPYFGFPPSMSPQRIQGYGEG